MNVNKELLPSEEDLKSFNEKGWYKTGSIFSDEEINAAVKGANDFYNGIIDFPLFNKEGLADDMSGEEAKIRNNEFTTLQKKELRALGWHPHIREIAKVLTGSSEIRLFADSLITKLPAKKASAGSVGWHSDKAYWPTCTSNKLLTVWIPLQDCTIDMGPLVYIDGSHKWKDEKELRSYFSFNNQDLLSFENYLDEKKQGYKKSFMTLKKGQACFHSCHTIHSSYPNVSQISRLALAVHLQDDSNKYQEAFHPDGKKIVIGYDKVCSKDLNGNPNYKDNKVFPLL